MAPAPSSYAARLALYDQAQADIEALLATDGFDPAELRRLTDIEDQLAAELADD